MKLKWIASEGGPLLLVQRPFLSKWEGCNPPSGGRIVKATSQASGAAVATDYDRACDINDYLGILSVGEGIGVVLGDEPAQTAWLPKNDGCHAILVRWIYADDEDSLLSQMGNIPDSVWGKPQIAVELSADPVMLFDAALSGADLDERLEVSLPPGQYRVDTACYEPLESISVVLHRFVRS